MKSFKFKSRLLFSCLAMFVFSTVLFISCDNEEILVEQQEQGANDDASLNRGPNKIDVCHYSADDDQWFIINVAEKAWPDHELHGDVRLDDQDGDGYVPDNECGFGTMGDCDDNCPYANLDLYGPYIDIIYFEDLDGLGNPAFQLSNGAGQFILVAFNWDIVDEWEFTVFDDVWSCDLNTQYGLPCDDPNVCPYFVSISEEGALCLIEQALSLGLPSSSSRTNDLTADNRLKKLQDK